MASKGSPENIRHDLPASIMVCCIAMPLCLGIALASGAPLFAGVIAGIVGGMIVGMASGSPLGVSGPAAGLAVIVLAANNSLSRGAFLGGCNNSRNYSDHHGLVEVGNHRILFFYIGDQRYVDRDRDNKLSLK